MIISCHFMPALNYYHITGTILEFHGQKIFLGTLRFLIHIFIQVFENFVRKWLLIIIQCCFPKKIIFSAKKFFIYKRAIQDSLKFKKCSLDEKKIMKFHKFFRYEYKNLSLFVIIRNIRMLKLYL